MTGYVACADICTLTPLQVFLGKIGEKLGDVESLAAAPPTAASAAFAASAPPEINSIFDAAKCASASGFGLGLGSGQGWDRGRGLG